MAWQYIGDGEWYDPVTGEYAYGDAGSFGTLGSNGSNWTSGNTADLYNNSASGSDYQTIPITTSSGSDYQTIPITTSSGSDSGYDASSLPSDFDVTTYEYLNPDLVTFYNEIKNNPNVYSDYWGRSITEVPSLQEFLKEHYVRSGAKEGRKYKQDAAASEESGGDWSGSSSSSGGGGGGGGTSYGIRTSSGLSSYEAMVKEMLANAKSPEQEATEKQAFEYAKQSLSRVNALADLGESACGRRGNGQLSDEEKALFDEGESAAPI